MSAAWQARYGRGMKAALTPPLFLKVAGRLGAAGRSETTRGKAPSIGRAPAPR
jgi:hypothetical protein